jgi:plastocyanin
MIRTPWQVLRIAAVLAFLAAGSAHAKETTIVIDNFTFAPAEATVKAGTKVLFVNHDEIPHTIVLADDKVRSKALDTDDSFAFVFDKPGDFVYFCGLHPHMKGEIKVTP